MIFCICWYKVVVGDIGFLIVYEFGVFWWMIVVVNGVDFERFIWFGQVLLILMVIVLFFFFVIVVLVGLVFVFLFEFFVVVLLCFVWLFVGLVCCGFVLCSVCDYYDGFDIWVSVGIVVCVIVVGIVIFVGEEQCQFGKLVVVDYGVGWYLVYGFFSCIMVKCGEVVCVGECVGLVGCIGFVKGDELYFELCCDNWLVDLVVELFEW